MNNRVVVLSVVLAVVALAASYLRELGRGDSITRADLVELRDQIRKDTLVSMHNTILHEATDPSLISIQQYMGDTRQLIGDRMYRSNAYKTKADLLTYALDSVDKSVADGLYCEFGVASGTTINVIASHVPKRTIHGFDSFDGLPERWIPGYEKGTFKMTTLPEVKDNVKLYKGWFDASVPIWAKENPGPIAFMHLDADLYSSTKTVLDLLGDRLQVGSVLEFDEFSNYVGWQHGEFQAFEEFLESHQAKVEYLGYTLSGREPMQVAVRITAISPRKK